MKTLNGHDGKVIAVYLEESDLAGCRCGGKAQYKRNTNQTFQVRCSKCGMQTAMRTDGQSVMREWNKVMGGVMPYED